ncbi:MAG: DUF2339 domain-containing protein [Bacteroidales bacterium]|nr:DUF2339 domain-containing protein [Bacteroidales bacterium]
MSDNENTVTINGGNLADRIRDLEIRVSQLENGLVTTQSDGVHSDSEDVHIEQPETGFSGAAAFESKFGEFGLAWLGNLVLLFGIIFLVQYFQNTGLKILAPVFGYGSVAGLFAVSWYLRNSHRNMASIFSLNGYILLYFITLKLHYFTKEPLASDEYVGLTLLLIVTLFQGIMAIRRNSQRLGGLAFIMGIVTAIVSDSTHVMLPLTVIISATAVYFMVRYSWWRLLVFSIILVYFTNLLWLIHNPFMGHRIEALKIHDFGFIYLFIVAAIYSLVALIRQKETFSGNAAFIPIMLNGLGFSFLVTLFVLAFFKTDYIMLFASIALFCMVYSVILKSRSDWKVIASLYALYGFVALSVTAYGIYGFPRAYFLLSLQSLLVVSMALWFRSRVIVVMNTGLFLILLFAYLVSSTSVNSVNISFALVALITARTLNWKKQMLQIKTELLRNTNLITGFFMVLYALYRLVPGPYVTLSWTSAAILYFVLSFALHNIKYRYLALATMVATALYLFIVDLARVEIIFRVVAFLFLAVLSIVLSLYYTKRRNNKPGFEE